MRWRELAAAVLLVCIGFGGGWSARRAASPPVAGISALAQEATDSYRVYASDAVRPTELGASEQATLVSWASSRLGSPVAVPNLLASGYRFVGGRLVATPHGAAALLIYDNATGDRLGLLTRRMQTDKEAAMTATVDGDVGRITWADRGIGHSLVAVQTGRPLRAMADDVRRQLLAS